MIRILSLLVGAFFTVVLGYSFVRGAYTAATEPTSLTLPIAVRPLVTT